MDVILALLLTAVVIFVVAGIAALLFVWAGVGLAFGQAFLIACGIGIAARLGA